MFVFHSHKIPFIDNRIRNTLVRVKNNWTAGDLTGDFGNQYECIAFMPKEGFKLKSYRYSNVLEFDRVPPTELTHSTEKPIMLLKKLIECATNPGDIVLDCFCGTGSTLVSCLQMGRQFIGFEKEKVYFDAAEKRIKKAQGQGKIGAWFN